MYRDDIFYVKTKKRKKRKEEEREQIKMPISMFPNGRCPFVNVSLNRGDGTERGGISIQRASNAYCIRFS